MKKVLALVLALVMALSLTACGGNNSGGQANDTTTESVKDEYSKESLMAIANDSSTNVIDVVDMMNDTVKNKAKAKQKYCNQVVVVSGYVHEIKSDYVVIIGSSKNWSYQINAYLPTDEIVDLENSQKIDIVGHFTEEISEGTYVVPDWGDTLPTTFYTMDKAYTVNDRYTVTGKLFGANSDYDAYNILVPPTSKVAWLVYFRDGEENKISGIDSEITFESKIFINGDKYEYKDAIIK